MRKLKYFNGRSDLPALPPDSLHDRMNSIMICSETNAQSTSSFVSLQHCRPYTVSLRMISCTFLTTDQGEHMLPRAVLRQSRLAKQLSCVNSALRVDRLWLHDNSKAVGSCADHKASYRILRNKHPHNKLFADTESREFRPAY